MNMKIRKSLKKALAAASVLFACIAANPRLLAEYHSSEEIKGIIEEVNQKHSFYASIGTINFAEREMRKIETYTRNAEKSLSGGNNGKAYYEIMKAKNYYKLIDAKKLLIETETKARAYEVSR
jgi:glycyl-tRNA synthetase alpha subunit